MLARVATCIKMNWHEVQDSCADAVSDAFHGGSLAQSTYKAAYLLTSTYVHVRALLGRGRAPVCLLRGVSLPCSPLCCSDTNGDDYDDDEGDDVLLILFIAWHVFKAVAFGLVAFIAVRCCVRRCRRKNKDGQQRRRRGCCCRRRQQDTAVNAMVVGQTVQMVDAADPVSDDEGVMYVPSAPGNSTQRLTRV